MTRHLLIVAHHLHLPYSFPVHCEILHTAIICKCKNLQGFVSLSSWHALDDEPTNLDWWSISKFPPKKTSPPHVDPSKIASICVTANVPTSSLLTNWLESFELLSFLLLILFSNPLMSSFSNLFSDFCSDAISSIFLQLDTPYPSQQFQTRDKCPNGDTLRLMWPKR